MKTDPQNHHLQQHFNKILAFGTSYKTKTVRQKRKEGSWN